MLRNYGRRSVAALHSLQIGSDQIRKAILRAGGSAPGADGVPYELFHVGLDFVCELVGQAFHAAKVGSTCLDRLLGPNIELL
eukprot:6227207-Alexandrium_andersonii.AAC.1